MQRKEGKIFAQKHLTNSGNIPSGFENRTPWLELRREMGENLEIIGAPKMYQFHQAS